MPPVKIWNSVLEKALRSRLSPALPPPPPPPPALPPSPPPPGRWSTFGSDVSADIYTNTVKFVSGAVFCGIGIVCTGFACSDVGEKYIKKLKSKKIYKFLFPSKEVAYAPQSLVVDILVLQAQASTGPFAKNAVKDAHSFLWGVPGGIYAEVSKALKMKKENESAK